MPEDGPENRPRRALKAGGPPATITAALGVGASGIAGRGIERETRPVANWVAETAGVEPQWGPVLVVTIAILILIVALFVPQIFEGRAV